MSDQPVKQGVLRVLHFDSFPVVVLGQVVCVAAVPVVGRKPPFLCNMHRDQNVVVVHTLLVSEPFVPETVLVLQKAAVRVHTLLLWSPFSP